MFVDVGILVDVDRAVRIVYMIIGENPDHIVVMQVYNEKEHAFNLYNPALKIPASVCSKDRFLDAWADSSNYLIVVKPRDWRNYKPHPIDLSDGMLRGDLNNLKEAIAENAHEVWAEQRQKEGWSYGPT